MLGYVNLVSLSARAVILLFLCLSLKVALSQARVHATWLLPSCVEWGLLFCGYLMTLSASIIGFSGSVAEGLHFAELGCFNLGTLCLAWSAVALYRTMKSVTVEFQVEHEDKDIWPPPPRQ